MEEKIVIASNVEELPVLSERIEEIGEKMGLADTFPYYEYQPCA